MRKVITGFMRRHGNVEPGFLAHFADHVGVQIAKPVTKILGLERTGGEIDGARIGGSRTHADGDQRVVASDQHRMREGVLCGAGAVALPVEKGRVVDLMTAADQAAVA